LHLSGQYRTETRASKDLTLFQSLIKAAQTEYMYHLE